MVSAVFHSPGDAAAAPITPVSVSRPAAANEAAMPVETPKPRPKSPSFDWRALAMRVLPPVLGMAVLEASRWIDAGLSNKNKMAETIADKAYVNTGVDAINQRILGRYQNGLGKTWDDPRHMKFFDDGAVNYPYLSDGMWFLTQHKRWGLLKDHPDYLGTAKAINQTALYSQAASALKISVPKDPMRSSKLLDGVVWDGKDPAKYADSFKVKA